MKTYAHTARDHIGPVPDPQGMPTASAIARLAEEKELFPYAPHWSYNPACARKAKRYNRSKIAWSILSELEDI